MQSLRIIEYIRFIPMLHEYDVSLDKSGGNAQWSDTGMSIPLYLYHGVAKTETGRAEGNFGHKGMDIV